ncbi:MAG TPA: glycosyltransferase family 4 protein [Candidatus Paceibacterota bacterium]|nr:glycosyltransferase family 4 protein [Candidatus Paceibacterota bacterium]
MKSQKTAIVFAPYFPPQGGGLERYARHISASLANEYHWRVVVVTSGDRGGADRIEEYDGLRVHRLAYRHKISNTPFSFGWFRKIRAILNTEKPDLINVHMPVPGIGDVAWLLSGKTPLVVTYHAGSMHKNKFRDDVLIWLYEHGPLQFLLRRADRIICSSDFIRFNLLKKYLYKSVTIMPGVDADFFTPDASKRSPMPTVLFVAALNRAQEQKGLKTLLAAAKIARATIPNLGVTVVGTGDMEDEYKAYARELGIDAHVAFMGGLEGKDLRDAYQSAHVFALPSANEALGMVILEAMACEVPVIGANSGGIPLIIDENKTGLLVQPKDPDGLAREIVTLLKDPAKSAEFGKTAREMIIKDFNWKGRTDLYDEVLTQMLGKKAEHITRITVVASYFYPKIGGLENYAYLLAKNLNASGKYKMSVITSNYDGKGYRQDVIDGMTVHRLPIMFRISNTPINPFWPGMIKKIYDAEQPDIVHVHSPVPYMADVAEYEAQDRAVVLTYHSGSMLKGRWPIDIVIGFYEKIFLPMLFKRANIVVAVSQEFARRTFPQFNEKIHFIPTGVDLSRFKKTPLPDGTKTVTYVGRIEHSSSWKGIEPLLQAMALVIKDHPDVRLELVGGGDAIGHYRERADALGIGACATLTGPLLGNALVDAYKRATVVVLPSTSDSEAFSIALIEAMASGRPIIGTAIGGTPQVIENGKNGLLVPPKDPRALADAIEKVVMDKALATHLADHGATRAQNFSWDAQAMKYSDLFATLS